MKILDVLKEADIALIGAFYYDIDYDELVEASEEDQRKFVLSVSGNDMLWLKIDLHQPLEPVEDSLYPRYVVQTSDGVCQLTPFKLEHIKVPVV